MDKIMEKVNEYFKILYPTYKDMSHEEQGKALKDKEYIRDNLGKIEEGYKNRCGDGMNPQQAIRETIRSQKIDKYFKILYPEYKDMSHEEQGKALKDKEYIRDNLWKIEEGYKNRRGDGMSPQQAIRATIISQKTDKYFEILYPEYKDMSHEEQGKALKDKEFIRDNLNRIELMYQNARSNGISPEEAIKGAIELRKKISAKKIGQATINTPTTAKREAEQVENGENTRDNIKEGEEVGDDN